LRGSCPSTIQKLKVANTGRDRPLKHFDFPRTLSTRLNPSRVRLSVDVD
jgi:hypothetical protein